MQQLVVWNQVAVFWWYYDWFRCWVGKCGATAAIGLTLQGQINLLQAQIAAINAQLAQINFNFICLETEVNTQGSTIERLVSDVLK